MWQARPSSVATRNGVIAGVMLGILSLPILTISAVGRALGRLTPLPTLFLLLAVIVFVVVGFLATRRAGLLRSGVWSGFLAGLITAFIAVCLGIVILTLLAPIAQVAPLRRGGRGVGALLARVVILRLLLAGLVVMVVGAIAGLLGGALGLLGRPGGTPPASGAGYAPLPSTPPIPPNMPHPPTPQPDAYTPAPAQPYADPYHTPAMGATPTPYYRVATPYEDDTPTVFHPGEE
ncbi:MAG TPA: hypothetical protein VF725_10945 [Ktedonobacterales bacterium]